MSDRPPQVPVSPTRAADSMMPAPQQQAAGSATSGQQMQAEAPQRLPGENSWSIQKLPSGDFKVVPN